MPLLVAPTEDFDSGGLSVTLDVAFGEPNLLRGKPLSSTLRQYVTEVDSLLNTLIPVV
jgi:hypothetical protein